MMTQSCADMPPIIYSSGSMICSKSAAAK